MKMFSITPSAIFSTQLQTLKSWKIMKNRGIKREDALMRVFSGNTGGWIALI